MVGDIIFADQASGLVYFSDDSNSAVDVVDGRHNRLLAQVHGFTNGPNGVLANSLGQIWAADGNGTVHVIAARPPFRSVGKISVGANADELAFAPRGDVTAVTSPDGRHPYVSLIRARGRRRVYARIYIPGAPKASLEQPQWDPGLDAFVESVRRTRAMPRGAVAVIDPVRGRLVRMIPLHGTCIPNGLAGGVRSQALAGCGVGGPELISTRTGGQLKRYSGRTHCCADEVAFDALDGRYFVAEAGGEGPPPAPQLKPPAVLVISAVSHRVLTAIRLGRAATGVFHQVAALGPAGRIFVPEADGIHVYAPR